MLCKQIKQTESSHCRCNNCEPYYNYIILSVIQFQENLSGKEHKGWFDEVKNQIAPYLAQHVLW